MGAHRRDEGPNSLLTYWSTHHVAYTLMVCSTTLRVCLLHQLALRVLGRWPTLLRYARVRGMVCYTALR